MNKPIPITQPNLFCFNGSGNDSHEIKLTLSPGDLAAYDSLSRERWAEGDSVLVTDLATHQRWRVRRVNCGAGCFCAAAAVPASSVTGITLSDRELATTLFALRNLQEGIVGDSQFRDIIKDAVQFDGGINPLFPEEIDALCGERGGDIVDFQQLRYGQSFPVAAQALGAWRDRS